MKRAPRYVIILYFSIFIVLSFLFLNTKPSYFLWIEKDWTERFTSPNTFQTWHCMRREEADVFVCIYISPETPENRTRQGILFCLFCLPDLSGLLSVTNATLAICPSQNSLGTRNWYVWIRVFFTNVYIVCFYSRNSWIRRCWTFHMRNCLGGPSKSFVQPSSFFEMQTSYILYHKFLKRKILSRDNVSSYWFLYQNLGRLSTWSSCWLSQEFREHQGSILFVETFPTSVFLTLSNFTVLNAGRYTASHLFKPFTMV